MWFVQALCDEFDENSESCEINLLLTNVIRRVLSYQKYENSLDIPPRNGLRDHLPSIVSTLTKRLYLINKAKLHK